MRLRAARVMPGFLEAASVHLVEISEPLREAQRETLASRCPHSRPCTWHEAVDQVPEGPAIVIANEFLDALPIRQLVFGDDAWHERVVGIDGQEPAFSQGPGGGVGYQPTCRRRSRATSSNCARPRSTCSPDRSRDARPAVALFIDYGPAEPAYGDTLQAVRRHA